MITVRLQSKENLDNLGNLENLENLERTICNKQQSQNSLNSLNSLYSLYSLFPLTTSNLLFPPTGVDRRQQPRADQAERGAEADNEVVSVGWIGEKEIYLLFRLFAQDL